MTPEDVGTAIAEARKERDQIKAKLQEAPPVENIVALHPAALKKYEQQLGALKDALQAGLTSGDSTGAEALRDLIQTITIYRDERRPGGVRLKIAGRLNALLGYEPPPRRLWGTVVAEEGLEPPTQGL